MSFLSNDKLTIVGASGMIGSNIVQTVAMMRLTPNISLYDPYEQGLIGVVEEMRHCGFKGVNFTYSTDMEEAFTGSRYMISSGGAPRTDGMTREDLLKVNAEIAAQLGKGVKAYCPDLQHLTVVFNPTDITGLVALIHSGLEPSRVTTLAALDSTRLQSELAKHFNIDQPKVTGARTYGGHGEYMAVFTSTVKVDGTPLDSLIGTDALTQKEWNDLKTRVINGGSNIIKLRGRSSYQSPAYISVSMIRATMGGKLFMWPSGCYVNNQKYKHTMMAMETSLDKSGVSYSEPKGSDAEMAELKRSYRCLLRLRDEVVNMGIIPAPDKWHSLNPHL